MDVDSKDGFRSYYIQKIEELQLIVNEKSQNLRRLQAQRNELNAKGKITQISTQFLKLIISFFQFACCVRNFNYCKNKEVMLVKL